MARATIKKYIYVGINNQAELSLIKNVLGF